MAPARGKVTLSWMDFREPELFAELMQAVERVASKGAFILGEEVLDFEADFAAYCETTHAIGVSSGTEALVLVLRAPGHRPRRRGHRPRQHVLRDRRGRQPRRRDPALRGRRSGDRAGDRRAVEAAITDAHAVRHPGAPLRPRGRDGADPRARRRHGLPVIEDAAQAHGARYRRPPRRVDRAIAGCFSFYPAKNLGAWGDGGAVVTNDAELADRVRLLRAHGERPRYHHNVVGTTARLDAIQAAVLAHQAPRGWTRSTRAVAPWPPS